MPIDRFCERVLLIPEAIKKLQQAIDAKLEKLDCFEKKKTSILQSLGLQTDERQQLINQLGE